MKLQYYTVGPFAENTYLLLEEQEALIIDPGFSNPNEYGQVKRQIEEHRAMLRGIVLTHAHVDHVLGLSMVLEDFDVPVYLNDADRYLWNNFSSQAAMFGIKANSFAFDPEPLRPQSGWTAGHFTFDVLFTPGHAPDHISLYHHQKQLVIAGDTLFKEGIGRTDLYKGDLPTLKTSIQEQLYSLPDETTVYPGHGPETTIGHEKESNPFVPFGN